MEHLGEGIAEYFGRVPYICEYQYDFGGFHSFPDRKGWCLGDDGRWKSSLRPGPVGSLAAFLQAWIFFGLLAEFLGPAVPLEPEDFYTVDESGSSRITTAELRRYLHDWKTHILATGPKSYRQLIKAQLALDRAHSLVSKYCSVVESDVGDNWEIDPMISLSFQVLGETLSHAKSTTIKEAGKEITGWYSATHRWWGYSKTFLDLMRDECCPHSLHILIGRLQQSTTGLLYALYLSRRRTSKSNHTTCSTEVCKAHAFAPYPKCNNNKSVSKVCSCRHVGPDIGVLASHVREGKQVVLRYFKEKAKVDVVEYSEEMRFVILSHVWADGLGKFDGNTLPKCHLDSFIDLFSRLSKAEHSLEAGHSPNRPERPIYFWIDTLTIPIGDQFPDARRSAIKNMARMYAQATYTIVLDAGLMAQDGGGRYAETAMKILASSWMTRLWTLQEAYLSRRILFMFSNALVDMDALESRYKIEAVSPLSLVAHTYHLALLGPERQNRLTGRERNDRVTDGSIELGLLTSLWNALQSRTLSHTLHETLAMAALLQIDTEPFDDVHLKAKLQATPAWLDQKMRRLWSMIAQKSGCAIPTELIFVRGPKLSGRGFRWAPRSWLHRESASLRTPISINQVGANLTSEGLWVRCPGFKLHGMDSGQLGTHMRDPIIFPSDCSLSKWIVIQKADSVQIPSSIPSFGVITQNQSFGTDRQIALFVAIVEQRPNIVYAQILKHVWIHVEVELSRIQELKRNFQKNLSHAGYGEALGSDQQWCLDGHECLDGPDQTRVQPELRFYSRPLSNMFYSVAEKMKGLL